MPQIETKQIPFFVKSIDEENRTVTGIFAVHGNRDDGGDISENGSFEKYLKEGRSRVRFLWNHDGWQPPIASIIKVREIGRDELPEKVKEWAPDATGGMEVTRKYYEDVALSDWVFKAIQAGDIEEMSYRYEVHKYEIHEDEEKNITTRILKELELFDISDVNWGMNPATAGVKGIPVSGMTFTQHSEHAVSAVESFAERVQDRKSFREDEGRTLSDSVRERLQKVDTAIRSILAETEPKADPEEVREVVNNYLRIERELQGAG